MSRIDEALSRAGGQPSSSASSVNGAFVSPWILGDRDSQAPERESQVASVTETPEPVSDWQPSIKDSYAGAALVVDTFKDEWRERLAVGHNADEQLTEQFQRLASALVLNQGPNRLKVVLIASANPGDGKTLTALNLALILSESYRHRVLLVDADLRQPTLTDVVGLTWTRGLNDVLKAADHEEVSLLALTEQLALLSAGRGSDTDPVGGLSSPRMQQLLQEAAAKFDWVIVDSTPMRAATDANLICPLVDAAILVVKAGQTPHSAVEAAIGSLGRERIVGVVLNAVSPDDGNGPYRSYGHARAAAQAARDSN